MNPIVILKHEHKIIMNHIFLLDDMAFSVSVNETDFSSVFRALVEVWDQHEIKEELLFSVLAEEGYNVPVENIKFEHGELRKFKDIILEAINSGDEEKFKNMLKNVCGKMIDLLRAHTFAEEDILQNVSWEQLSEETLDKIKLLQILPHKDLLEN
ncbi:MAG: hemerythrin domain-containing protein [Nanoarchaeota archaeon]